MPVCSSIAPGARRGSAGAPVRSLKVECITVAVPAPADGLSTAQVATITDTIVKETDYAAPQIKVIEVKADAQDAQ